MQRGDLIYKNFTAKERRELLEKDILKCGYVTPVPDNNPPPISFYDDVALKNYNTLQEYYQKLTKPGSLKLLENIYNNLKTDHIDEYGKSLEFEKNSVNYMEKVEKIVEKIKMKKHLDLVVDDYLEFSNSPAFTSFIGITASAYCRKNILQCMGKGADNASVEEAVSCILKSAAEVDDCMLDITRYIDSKLPMLGVNSFKNNST